MQIHALFLCMYILGLRLEMRQCETESAFSTRHHISASLQVNRRKVRDSRLY